MAASDEAKMQIFLIVAILSTALAEDVRLLDLEPNEAAQLLESKDQSLHYAPKIETNVPAVRFLGNEPHQVLEDIYLANQYHGQDGLGGYLYGYSVPDIAKTEKKKAGGDLRGAYNYINGDGKEIKVEYWDDGTGFHQVDNVDQIQPQQVEDTPEVKAAREEHFRIWQEEAERNSKAPADPNANYDAHAISPQYQQPGQVPQYQQPGPQPAFPRQPIGQSQPAVGFQSVYQGQFSGPSTARPFGSSVVPNYSGQVSYQGQFSTASPQFSSTPKASFGVSSTVAPNQVDYSGQYSEKRQVYASGPQQQQGQYQQPGQYQQQQGQYQQKNEEEEEEVTGPPRGFFYNFDYPVGIIVQKQGELQKRDELHGVYEKNKEEFQQQLKTHGDYRPTRSAFGGAYPSYMIVTA